MKAASFEIHGNAMGLEKGGHGLMPLPFYDPRMGIVDRRATKSLIMFRDEERGLTPMRTHRAQYLEHPAIFGSVKIGKQCIASPKARLSGNAIARFGIDQSVIRVRIWSIRRQWTMTGQRNMLNGGICHHLLDRCDYDIVTYGTLQEIVFLKIEH